MKGVLLGLRTEASMLILTCLSFAGTIWSSLTLHRLPFNALLMSLGIVCLFECLANLAASVVYLIAQVGTWYLFCTLFTFYKFSKHEKLV